MLHRIGYALASDREVLRSLEAAFPRLYFELKKTTSKSKPTFNDYLFVRGFVRHARSPEVLELDSCLAATVIDTDEPIWCAVREAIAAFAIIDVFFNIVSVVGTYAHAFLIEIYPFLLERTSCFGNYEALTPGKDGVYFLRGLSLGVTQAPPVAVRGNFTWLLDRLNEPARTAVARRVDVAWCVENGADGGAVQTLLARGAHAPAASLGVPRLVAVARLGIDHEALRPTTAALRTALVALCVRLRHTPLIFQVVRSARWHVLLQPHGGSLHA